MLAVAEQYQNCGLGFALKQTQRVDALRCGIRLMRWTFDPLMSKNAFFNLHRLGATARLYVHDFYGQLGSSLQGGLPTDRLLAEWPLESPRVLSAAAAGSTDDRLNGPTVVERITLSPSIAAMKAKGRLAEAEAEQAALRRKLTEAFARGLSAVDFVPSPGGGGDYLLAAET